MIIMSSPSASSSQRREFHLHTAIHMKEYYCNIYRNFSISLMTLCLACHKNIIMWNIYVCVTLPSKHIIFLFFYLQIHTFHNCSIKIIEKQKTTDINLLSAFLCKAFGKCQRIEQTTLKSCFINTEKKKDTLKKTGTV
jgi:hypothetical protein